jgi:putative tryptophan/tyrosine transport system substrate-binding protein
LWNASCPIGVPASTGHPVSVTTHCEICHRPISGACYGFPTFRRVAPVRDGSKMAIIGRRQLIVGLGGAAVTWSLTARAQQVNRVRRVGVLMSRAAGDPEEQARFAGFLQGLQKLGWTDGGNVRIDYRWAAAEAYRSRTYAAELVALAPDVILASGSTSVAALLQTTRTVPIVFVNVIDPVGAGYVARLARPGGNATGFTAFEYSLSGKWLELLKEIAPNLTLLRDPALAAGIGQFAAIQAMAPSSFGVELSPIDVRDGGEIERDVATLASEPNGGLIVTGSSSAAVHRELIVMLAARHRLPAVYPFRYFVTGGGLISYGPDPIDVFRRAASYVDRILKGEKAADLPVQAPTTYELAINLKTAKALGLIMPPLLLVRADQLIE